MTIDEIHVFCQDQIEYLHAIYTRMSIGASKIHDISNDKYYHRKALRLLVESFEKFVEMTDSHSVAPQQLTKPVYEEYATAVDMVTVPLESQYDAPRSCWPQDSTFRYYSIGDLLNDKSVRNLLNDTPVRDLLRNIAMSRGWIFVDKSRKKRFGQIGIARAPM